MKALSIVITLILGVGFIAAAVWMSNAQPPVKTTAAKHSPPADLNAEGPKVAKEGPYPQAVVDKTEYDFGTLMHGTKGHHTTFVIRNEGAAPLELVALEKDRTCQCTGAKLASDGPVPPGGEVTVEMTWKIELDNPSFRHSAKIRTNDPDHEVIQFSITGNVEKTFQYDPPGPLWDLGEITGGGNAVVTSTKAMFSQALKEFEITKLSCKNPKVKCRFEPLSADELTAHQATSGYMLHVEADFNEFTGAFSETVELSTSVTQETPIVLHLKARKLGPIELIARNWDPQTNRLMLGEFPASQGKHAEISVYTRVEGEVKLLSSKSEHDGVKVAWEKDEQFQSKAGKTHRYRLKIDVPPASPVSRKRADAEKVDLEFDQPEIGKVRILVDYLAI